MNREFDEMGAHYNAFTSEEHTVYYAAVLPEYQTSAVELLGDIIRPSLREEDFTTEKQVIIEEIRMYEDQPPFGADDKCKAAYFQVALRWAVACWERSRALPICPSRPCASILSADTRPAILLWSALAGSISPVWSKRPNGFAARGARSRPLATFRPPRRIASFFACARKRPRWNM